MFMKGLLSLNLMICQRHNPLVIFYVCLCVCVYAPRTTIHFEQVYSLCKNNYFTCLHQVYFSVYNSLFFLSVSFGMFWNVIEIFRFFNNAHVHKLKVTKITRNI